MSCARFGRSAERISSSSLTLPEGRTVRGISVRRRDALTLLGGAAAASIVRLHAARAQQQLKIPRVGYPFSLTEGEGRHLWEACWQGLRELGYIEGQNIILEPHWVEGRYDRLSATLAEFERLRVDAMVVAATPGNVAAKARASTIPVVFVAVADPLRAGLIASFSRPSGRFTGLSLLTPELSGKRLELLAEAARGLSRVAVLLNPGNLSNFVFLEETQAAARRFGIELQPLEIRNPREIEKAFAAAVGARASAVIAFDDPVIHSDRARIVALTATHRLPAMYGTREFADEGGLMAYGPHRPDLYRRSAVYVDKILKGAKPADLPVEQPTKFELVINLKAAKQLGLDVPPTLVARADEVIE
jgi:putative ABC transport system substrate-binding protein